MDDVFFSHGEEQKNGEMYERQYYPRIEYSQENANEQVIVEYEGQQIPTNGEQYPNYQEGVNDREVEVSGGTQQVGDELNNISDIQYISQEEYINYAYPSTLPYTMDAPCNFLYPPKQFSQLPHANTLMGSDQTEYSSECDSLKCAVTFSHASSLPSLWIQYTLPTSTTTVTITVRSIPPVLREPSGH